MARPNFESSRDFYRRFLSFIKDKPFYIINTVSRKPRKKVIPRKVDGDERGELYYVGGLLDGNRIFETNSRISVYWYEKDVKLDSTYWIDTVIDNFSEGSWCLVDWYNNGLTYQDIIKNFTSVENFNPFEELNESEEDDFGWAVETIREPLKLGSLWRNDSLRVGDTIALYGDVRDSEKSLFILKGEKFKVYDIRYSSDNKINTIDFDWLTPLDERPSNWRAASNYSRFSIDNSTMTPPSGNDGELVVEFVNEELNESKQLEHPINVGTPLYCHTAVNKYRVGEWYPIVDVLYEHGSNGEDCIIIYDKEDEESRYNTWTIQKDENGLNYEEWFSLGDPSFDTHNAFDTLYESEEFDWDIEDVSKYIKVGQKFSIPSLVGDHHTTIGVITKIRGDKTVWIAPDMSNLSFGTPFAMDKLVKILSNGRWTPIDSINESEEDDGLGWAKDVVKPFNKNLKTVIVISRGSYYPTNLEVMVDLGIPGAKEFKEKYGHTWWDSNEYREIYPFGGWVNQEGFLMDKIPSLVQPEDGDICFLINSQETYPQIFVSRLIRVKDGGEFIMGSHGFKRYNP